MRVRANPRQRAAVGRSVTVPAPIGGWNARDPSANMSATDAVILKNIFPATTECVLRSGYSVWATGLPDQVETLMTYEGGGATSEMWAVSEGKIYDVSSGGAVGAAAVTGLSDSRFQCANVTTAGGIFLYAANGLDKPQLYDGATWTAIDGASVPAITGVTTTKLNNPILFKNRVFFTEAGTLKTWYLPVQSVGGAAAAVDMSAFAQMGGYIVNHGTWTIDAGSGVDDYYVAVTNKGEVLVYEGTDPSDATKWALKGVWRIGAPVGTRCLYKYAGDLLIISQDGILPMSSALQSSRVNPRVALTDKIQYAISTAVTGYGANFGWELMYYPKENQLWLNVPVSVGYQEQYVMNSITKNWCQFTGWAANCFELWGDAPYFGGNGVVYKAWDTHSDNGTWITGVGLCAFNPYGNPGNRKRFTMSRPVLRVTGRPSVYCGINVDFDTTEPIDPTTFSPMTTAEWGSSLWGSSLWGSGLNVQQSWQSVSSQGFYGAPQLKVVSSGVDVRWVSTDVVFETGGML